METSPVLQTALQDHLQQGIDEVAQTYDELPYHSVAFTQSCPIRLHTVGTLFGQNPPDVATARVLEIGCAGGGNIIPWALAYPKARVVGIDISKAQVEQGQQAIVKLGLTNIKIEQRSASDIPHDFGTFDYIICHGVYSWVPAEVQNAIFSIAKNHLSEMGIAYISYNTYPGWKSRELVRDAMRMRAPKGGANQLEQLAYAKGMVEFLAEVAPPESLMHSVMSEYKNIVNTASTSYLAHEFLEIHNNPCYFKDFVARAANHQLAYLGEAEPHSMFLSNYGPRVMDLLQKECADGQLEVEQYLDFITNRPFRQTLLIRSNQAQQTRYSFTEEVLLKLHFSGAFSLLSNDKNAENFVENTYVNERGGNLTVPMPWQRDILHTLTAAFPNTITAKALLTNVLTLDSRVNKDDVLSFLSILLVTNIANYAATARQCAPFQSCKDHHKPVAYAPAATLARIWLDAQNALHNARSELPDSLCSVVNAWYEHTPLSSAAALALTLADGTRMCLEIQQQTNIKVQEFYKLGLITQS